MNPDPRFNTCSVAEQVADADDSDSDDTTRGDPDNVGRGKAQGKCINLAWSRGGMGDADYLHATTRLLLPVAYDFRPDLVLVGPRFDAADAAYCGTKPEHKHKLSGECFAHILACTHKQYA